MPSDTRFPAILLFSTLAALVTAASAGAAVPAPRLVADLGDPAGALPSAPSEVVSLDGGVFFTAADGLHGAEPWISDGTADGTRVLADLRPGPEGSQVATGGALRARDGIAYVERTDGLWRSDGTALGTWRLGGPGRPLDFLGFAGATAIATRRLDAGGLELWAIVAGDDERRIATLVPTGFRTVRGESLEVAGRLLFSTDDRRLWLTDGTGDGTRELARLRATPSWLGTRGTTAYLAADRSTFEPTELLAVDVTSGAVAELGPVGDLVTGFVTSDGLLLATGSEVTFRPFASPALGTPRRVPQLEAVGGLGAFVATVDGRVLATVCTTPSRCELRAWDGEDARTLVSRLERFAFAAGRVDGGVVVASRSPAAVYWTDGSVVRHLGDRHVARPGAALAGRLYALADTDGATPALVAIDAATMETVRSFPPARPGSRPRELTVHGGTFHGDEVWLLADDARDVPGGRADVPVLWHTVGGGAGVREVEAVASADFRSQLASLGERLLVSADALRGYRADGSPEVLSPAGCFLTEVPSREPGRVVVAGDAAFFRCAVGDRPREALWALEAGAPTAQQVVAAEPLLEITPFAGGEVLFVTLDVNPPQLWIASAAGARSLRSFDITSGNRWQDFYPRHFQRLAGAPGPVAVFAGYEGATGWDLWRTDGTAEGTTPLGVFAGEGLAGLPFVVGFGDGVAVMARRASGDDELWLSDGTAAGTRRVSALRAGGTGGVVESLVATADRLFLAARHRALGSELWVSDGTAVGTRPLEQVPGRAGARPHRLTAIGDVLFFAADDGVHGAELWTSDGTVPGTRRRTDLAPGVASSDPGELTVLGDRLLFAAGHPDVGRELWALDELGTLLAAAAPCDGPVHCFQDERFRVAVTWDDDRTTGAAQPVPGASDDSGLFTFFSADNWEILVKVLDGCAIDGSYWVFAAAATHVGTTIEVTDRATGERRVYDKPYGPPAPALTATGAFACAP